MSNFSNANPSLTIHRGCDCYKRLEQYGVPLYIDDENDLYTESPRKITYENAFKLPGYLKINENITEYLLVEDNDLCNVFLHMAEVIPILSDFEVNVLNFWLLDIFIEGLWTAQNAKMNFEHQKATLLWIAYGFNYLQKENPSRKNFFNHLKGILFHIGCYRSVSDLDERMVESLLSESSTSRTNEEQTNEKKIWQLPLPPQLEKERTSNYEEKTPSASEEENSVINDSEASKSTESSVSYQKFTESDSETNVKDMKIILEILYRIFGGVWAFLEIQTAFHSMPPITQVDLPFKLHIPKPLLKIDTSTQFKTDKSRRRQTISEKSSEEVNPVKELHKNDYILPLQAADESKILLKELFSSSQRSGMERKKT